MHPENLKWPPLSQPWVGLAWSQEGETNHPGGLQAGQREGLLADPRHGLSRASWTQMGHQAWRCP